MMSYQIYDKFRAKVISTYETEIQLEKAMQHFSNEDNRYEIVAPAPKKPRKTRAKKESD
tara:strand:- start:389 stop:565 length:177 start_codon:yes stop_codon:yes gene_type:complete